MYFHPLILTEAQKQQRQAAWDDMTRMCLAGIERHHRLHADACDELFRRHQKGAQTVLEALDLANELANWSALAVRMPLQLLPISLRSAEIAAELHRTMNAVAAIYVSPASEGAVEKPMDRSAVNRPGAVTRTHRPQVMA